MTRARVAVANVVPVYALRHGALRSEQLNKCTNVRESITVCACCNAVEVITDRDLYNN